MRPLKIFIVLIIFLICFAGLSYFLPQTFNLPDIAVFIPSEFLKQETAESPALVMKQVENQSVISDADTVYHKAGDGFGSGSTLNFDLNKFIDSLLLSTGQVRILYYGDSQLEGDRITSYLRQVLQEEFGGTGPGLILPLMPVMYTKSVYVRSSSNWERYNYLSYKNGETGSNKLGPFMTICRFLPPSQRNESAEKATVRIIPSKFANRTAASYEKLKLFYGNIFDTVIINVYTGKELIGSETLIEGAGPFMLCSDIGGASEVTLEFTGKSSPDVYGISLESESGVIVDNIPQRGSAGLEFTMVDKGNLDSVYQLLKPDLFVLQYGLNIVRNIRDNYTYYENGLYRQILLLKELCPETPVMVLSLTDMAFTQNDSIKPYPNIESIRDAQKLAAMRAGAAFWDTYNEMGGKNSIIKWVNNQPPLAQKDYTHLTYSGADSLSRLLLSSLSINNGKNTGVQSDEHPQTGSEMPLLVNNNSQREQDSSILILRKLLKDEIFNYDPEKPFIFTSAAFWIFFLIVLALYSLVYKKMIIRNTFLFLISLFFYYKTGGVFFILLLFVIVVDYSVGLLISGSEKRYLRRIYLLLSLISNFGILVYFKYTAFLVNSFNTLFNTEAKVVDIFSLFANNNFGTTFDISTIILPVGISFFTFQSVSYTIDVYRRRVEPVKNIIDFGFYVSFFPQLVAGPIVRASEFIPQLYLKFALSRREFGQALFLITKGLIKKIIISDFIANNLIDRVFDAPALYSGFENLTAVYGYGLQIYCDFSGYTDMAIGLGLLLGFRLPVNFNSPYKASGIADFWKRWHISLSRWLKDYLYIPLGGNRHGKLRTYINLFITMLLGGLWHGASLMFVLWGALHGIGLVFNKFSSDLFRGSFYNGKLIRAAGVFITFQFVSFCWIFFRADGMDNVILMLRQITGNFSPGSYLEIIPAYFNVFCLILVGYAIHFLPDGVKESYRGIFINLPLLLKLAVVLIIGFLLFQMKTTGIQPFIYFRF